MRQIFRVAMAAALFCGCAGAAGEEYTYWIEPCTPEKAHLTGCEAGDAELGRWALQAWQRESNGAVTFRAAGDEAHARIRLKWEGGTMSLYGETQPIVVEGRRGSLIYVLPETGRASREDQVLRDAIVYLTCVHEAGHALGLPHTAAFADIMYSFQYGGDIVEYFGRYRRQLKTRADIAGHAGISDADRAAVRALGSR